METLASLEAKIAALQEKLEAKKKAERAGVIAQVQAAIKVYGITTKELKAKPATPVVQRKRILSEKELKQHVERRRKRTGVKRRFLPKYGDSEGNTWSGGGSIPRWMRRHLEAGKKKEDFRLSEFDRRAA